MHAKTHVNKDRTNYAQSREAPFSLHKTPLQLRWFISRDPLGLAVVNHLLSPATQCLSPPLCAKRMAVCWSLAYQPSSG